LLVALAAVSAARRTWLDPRLAASRLARTTRRLVAVAERLAAVAPPAGDAAARLARLHGRSAAARVALLERRDERALRRRRARSRREKRRGLELLAGPGREAG
jgi:hypothetical protein